MRVEKLETLRRIQWHLEQIFRFCIISYVHVQSFVMGKSREQKDACPCQRPENIPMSIRLLLSISLLTELDKFFVLPHFILRAPFPSSLLATQKTWKGSNYSKSGCVAECQYLRFKQKRQAYASPNSFKRKRRSPKLIATWKLSKHHRRHGNKDETHGDHLYRHLCSWRQVFQRSWGLWAH